MNKVLSIILISLYSLTFISCAKKSSDDSSSTTTTDTSTAIKITGKVSSSETSSRSSLATSSTSSPDKILAMYGHGKYSADSGRTSSKEFPIQSDGSFEVDTSLLNEDKLVVFVVNSTSKTIYGHLNLEASNDEKLEMLDTSKMEKDLSLGNVDCADNCSSEETLSTTTSFKSSELDNLQNISRSDDAVALYSNDWRNPTIESYVSTVFYMGSLSNLGDNYTAVDNFSKTNNFYGMHPLFYSSLDNISGLYLFPPSPIKYDNKSTGFRAPDNVTNNWSSSADNSTPININSINWSSGGQVTTISSPNIKSFPSGDWRLTYTDNTTFGNFQFVGADPFDNGSNLKTFFPSIKINSNSSGKWLSFNLMFYKQSSSGNNESINSSYLNTVAYDEFCTYVLNGSNESKNTSQSDMSSTDTVWEFSPKTDEQISDVNRIICNYMIGQAKYSFYFYN